LSKIPFGRLSTVGTLIVAGEACAPELVAHWAAGRRMYNAYGPTETSVCATRTRPLAPHRRITIGSPLRNLDALLLDRDLRLVPVGVPGDLYVAGAGLAEGYQRRPALTAKAFVPNPYGASGTRLYRTGDRGRRLPDGTIEFIGRADEQIKINGCRVEPGEINALLTRHPGVRESFVAYHRREGNGALTAYTVGDAPEAELREHLARQLPSYMMPQRFIRLDALPLTTNGKVDRRALPAPDEAETMREPAAAGYAAPRTPVEALLCRIWGEVLGRERIGIHDNFFELGGDSILSIQIGVRAAQAGLTLTTRDLFEHQTIAALSETAALELPAGDDVDAARAGGAGHAPLTPIQRWFFAQELKREGHYNQAALLADAAPLEGAHLQAAVEGVLRWHEVFNLRYERVEGEVRQRYAGSEARQQYAGGENGARRCGRADLRALPRGAQGGVIEKLATSLQESLDLVTGKLVRALRFEVTGTDDDVGGAGRAGSTDDASSTDDAGNRDDAGKRGVASDRDGGRLLVVAHHLVIDGVSWRILLDQVERAYGELQTGRESVPDTQGSSFGQWAHALVREAASDETRRELNYWLTQQARADERLPRDHERGANTVESGESVAVEFDVEQTDVLLRELPRRLRAQVEEALLFGVVEALREWSGRTEVVVECEGHGREPVAGVDVSRTVGWFTTLYPVRFASGVKSGERRNADATQTADATHNTDATHAADATHNSDATHNADATQSVNATHIDEATHTGVPVAERLGEVKEQLRAVPRKGLGYGLLKYLGSARELMSGASAEVSFNYLGQWDANLGGLFRGATESEGASQWGGEERAHVVEVHGSVHGGRLRMVWTFSRNLHERETMERVAGLFRHAVEAVITACGRDGVALLRSEDDTAGVEDSDFSLSDAELDDLLAEVGARE
jgi:non-ribosomal peptide synthase protein (TIGR01720 family)